MDKNTYNLICAIVGAAMLLVVAVGFVGIQVGRLVDIQQDFYEMEEKKLDALEDFWRQ